MGDDGAMSRDDEFSEFDVTEEEFDAMAAQGEAVEIVAVPWLATRQTEDLYVLVEEPPATYTAPGATRALPGHVGIDVVGGGAVAQGELINQ